MIKHYAVCDAASLEELKKNEKAINIKPGLESSAQPSSMSTKFLKISRMITWCLSQV